jgi:hypothetical protein
MTSNPVAKNQHSGRFLIIPARAIDDPRLGKGALLTLCALGSYSDRDGWSWPSISTLAHRLRVSRRHIISCIKQLVDLHYVESKPRFDKFGKQQTNTYRILHDVTLPADLFEGGVKLEFTGGGVKSEFRGRVKLEFTQNVPV